MQEHYTYLSSLDEALVDRVRQTISTAAPQVEELRVGENVKRRRRVAPVQAAPPPPPAEPAPSVEAAPLPEPGKEEVVKRASPKKEPPGSWPTPQRKGAARSSTTAARDGGNRAPGS